jgi:bla regulator protein blaR1
MIPLAWHLLQSTVFAAAIGLVALAFRGDCARIRHWLWMAASVKFLVPLSLLVSIGSHLAWRTAPTPPVPELTFVMAVERQPVAPQPPVSAPARAADGDWVTNALWTLWLSGSVALLLRWRLRWTRMAAALRHAALAPEVVAQAFETVLAQSAARRGRHEKPGGGKMRVQRSSIRSSGAVLEPGVFGIFRPVLLLPAGIEQRLSGAQLEAVLAHELCHLRRRDNLAGAVHMLVESLFWFHPLVWWLGARLVEEREFACDEEVLRRGTNPELYAGSILSVCEFYFESRLPCVSGIAGADLQHRIESIMTARAAPQLRPGKKLLLTVFAIAAVAGPVALGMLHPSRTHAQTQPEPRTAAPLSFDVTSVKPVEQPWLQIAPQRSGGRITWTTDLHYLVGYAYHLSDWRISGPLPGSDHIYAFDVTTSPEATEDQVRLMFQSLLADRFKMEARRVTKEVEGYALTVSKNGPKIKEAKPGEEPAALPEWFQSPKRTVAAADLEGKIAATIQAPGVGAITGRRVSMLQLTEALQRVLRVAVVDQTNLSGKYYFAFEFAQENHPDDTVVPSLFSAIQESLGLKLEKHKGPVEMLVVDRIEKTPTEN